MIEYRIVAFEKSYSAHVLYLLDRALRRKTENNNEAQFITKAFHRQPE